jgi:hypothetical protein
VAEDLSTHSFRIGVAARLAAAGFGIDYIRRFGRWATVGMVDVYARRFEGSFAAGHAALCYDLPIAASTPAGRAAPPRQGRAHPAGSAAAPPPRR